MLGMFDFLSNSNVKFFSRCAPPFGADVLDSRVAVRSCQHHSGLESFGIVLRGGSNAARS